MFVFDVETLGKESNAIILSMACVHFDPLKKPSHEDLRANAFFAKFDVEDQRKRLKRSMSASTVDWWKKQCLNTKLKSFRPSAEDVIFEVGYERMREWAKSKNDPTAWVFARGNLDQLVLDDIEEQCRDLGYHVLEKHYNWDWYNNDGGYGSVIIIPGEDHISIDGYVRSVTEAHDSVSTDNLDW